ncbi:MAG: hypothetical protein IJ740_02950 [Ruminococcus sp.]|nr:hypothetical protein [Ruminococcus sp.]
MVKHGLDRVKIKYIAITAMIADHIAMFFLSKDIAQAPLSRIAIYSALRVIGRLTAPVMLFFLVEGFIHTSSRKKYGCRLLAFGLLSQIPYALSHYDKLLAADFNMILTLFVTFLMLLAYENIKSKPLNTAVVFILMMSTFCFDWGVIGPLLAWLFYKYRSDRNEQLKAYTFICAVQVVSAAVFLAANGHHWYGELWQAGMFLFVPVLKSYNGESGSKTAFNKWLFYIFYPLHLFVIWMIKY